MKHRIAAAAAAALLAAGLAPGTAGGEGRGAGGASPAAAAPLALTPAEYNNTIADLLGFPRDGGRWPARPAPADWGCPDSVDRLTLSGSHHDRSRMDGFSV